MRLGVAIKAFIKAWKNPQETERFLQGQKPSAEHADHSHLRLLTLLQHSGRLVDFFKEDLVGISDAQIGAAARKIHEDCKKTLEECVTIRPVMEEPEGATVKISVGYDPASVKIVGKVKGEPPYTGSLIHRGWKAHKQSLPKGIGEQTTSVISPAEVEVH